MSLLSQLPKPGNTYDLFRVTMSYMHILQDSGYLLEGYKYLTETLISSEEFKKLSKKLDLSSIHISHASDFVVTDNDASDASEDDDILYSEALKYKKFAAKYKKYQKARNEDSEWDLKEDFYLETWEEEFNLEDIPKYKKATKRVIPKEVEHVLLENRGDAPFSVIYETNKLATDLNAKPEDIIEIMTSKLGVYIKVIAAPKPRVITVVFCDPEKIIKIIGENMAAKVKSANKKGNDKKKGKYILDWVIITKSPAENDKVVIPFGYTVKFLYYQHLYVDPLTHVKSPPSMKKLSARESHKLKTLPVMKGLRFVSMGVEDSVAVRHDAKTGDIIEIHNNNYYSNQTTSGIVYREVR